MSSLKVLCKLALVVIMLLHDFKRYLLKKSWDKVSIYKKNLLIAVIFLLFSFGVNGNVAPPSGITPFLTLPFNINSVSIQQGWYYNFSRDNTYCNSSVDVKPFQRHCGIDYIKGIVDASKTWTSFNVFAAADGWAIANTNATGSKIIVMFHNVKDALGRFYFTIYQHLSRVNVADLSGIQPWGIFKSRVVSDAKNKNFVAWTPVKQGEKIGDAGDTGSPGLLHLHFEVRLDMWGARQSVVDPYDIAFQILENGIAPSRDYYPGGSLFKGCGQNHLWVSCSTVTQPPLSKMELTIESSFETNPNKDAAKGMPNQDTFHFEGTGFSPEASVTRHFSGPTGDFSSTIDTDSTGSLQWSFSPDCDDTPGVYTIQIEDVDGTMSNTVTEEILANPMCEPLPDDSPADTSVSLTTALIIDKSGSMNDPSKLPVAKFAAEILIRLARKGERILVAAFSTDGSLVSSLTEITSNSFETPEKGSIIDDINAIMAQGKTNFGAGLQVALDELGGNTVSTATNAIFMSNGQHNTGSYDQQVEEFQQRSWPIHTIAFGSDANQEILSKIASLTGGIFVPFSLPSKLISDFNRIRAAITGESLLASLQDNISQGQTKTLFLPTIDSATTTAQFLLSWAGSELDLTLLDPNGVQIDDTVANADPSISFFKGDVFALYTIENPTPGAWQALVTGVDVPGAESFGIDVTTTAGGGGEPLQTNFRPFKSRYPPGEAIRIELSTTQGNSPLTGADVNVRVDLPNGQSESLRLYDDGSHGDAQGDDGLYSNTFTNTDETGIYRLSALISGITRSGTPFMRSLKQTISVSLGLPGIDFNRDGTIDTLDAIDLARAILGFSNETPVDYNADGNINIDDAIDLARQILGLSQAARDQLAFPYAKNPINISQTKAFSTGHEVIFAVPGPGVSATQVEVYALDGRPVYSSEFYEGSKIRWDLRTNRGMRVANGVYLYVVSVRDLDGEVVRSGVKKLMVLN